MSDETTAASASPAQAVGEAQAPSNHSSFPQKEAAAAFFSPAASESPIAPRSDEAQDAAKLSLQADVAPAGVPNGVLPSEDGHAQVAGADADVTGNGVDERQARAKPTDALGVKGSDNAPPSGSETTNTGGSETRNPKRKSTFMEMLSKTESGEPRFLPRGRPTKTHKTGNKSGCIIY